MRVETAASPHNQSFRAHTHPHAYPPIGESHLIPSLPHRSSSSSSFPHRRSAFLLSPPHRQYSASPSFFALLVLCVAFFLHAVFLCLDAGLNRLRRSSSSSPSKVGPGQRFDQ